MLCGNKIDLIERNPEMRKILKEKAVNFALENDMPYFETSAITSINVESAFEKLL